MTNIEESLSTIVQLNISMKELCLSLNKEGTVFLSANLTNSMVNLMVQSNNDFKLEVRFQFEYWLRLWKHVLHFPLKLGFFGKHLYQSLEQTNHCCRWR
jgi:hypothetical protein